MKAAATPMLKLKLCDPESYCMTVFFNKDDDAFGVALKAGEAIEKARGYDLDDQEWRILKAKIQTKQSGE